MSIDHAAGSDTILCTVEGRVAVVTLNRPDRLNALSDELKDHLPVVLERLRDDLAVGCVVLTGAGRGFCSGGDLREREDGAAPPPAHPDAPKHYAQVNLLMARMDAARLIHLMPKPVIAMINGPCAGAGFSLAGACDLRFAGASAVLTSAFTRAGLSGDYGGTWFWTRILGTAQARELYMLSERIAAGDALARGLVHRVWPDDELRARTMTIAHAIADGPAWAHAYAKNNLNAAVDGSLEATLQLEATAMLVATETARASSFAPSSVLRKR